MDNPRARDERHTFMRPQRQAHGVPAIRLDKDFALMKAPLPQQQQQVEAVRARVRSLTRATQEMLLLICRALQLTGDPATGFTFRASVTRKQIAAEMTPDRATLWRYDVIKLQTLVDAELVHEEKISLPVRIIIGATGDELRTGAGYELHYSIGPEVLFALALISDPHIFDQLRPKRMTLEEIRAARAAESEPITVHRDLVPTDEQVRAIAREHWKTGRDIEFADRWLRYNPATLRYRQEKKHSAKRKLRGLFSRS